VPRPGAADLRVLEDHLRVVVVHLAAQQRLAAADQPLAAGEHAVHAVARVVPQRQPHHAALAVGPAERAAVELVVLLRGPAQEVDFFGVEEALRQNGAGVVVLTGLRCGEGRGHGTTPRGGC
jgi:hypothetical protein